MANCKQINTPELDVQPELCDGKYYSTLCVIQETPLIFLGFPQGGSNVSSIFTAISSTLSSQNAIITTLTEQVAALQAQVDSILASIS